MARGRPVKSQIRQNIIEILYFLGKAYGYNIFKVYKEVYPKVTMRSIYYHLRKGIETGEIKVTNIKAEKGEYSWGDEAEKIYYSLGDGAAPRVDHRVKEFLDSKGLLEKK
ncbi:hypothetical protein KY330_01665 [Candidatus Woesearchaeota archaeon]|nr:hypothetical protein [Candidatus Woesearchaeota archaeon]